MEDFFLLKQISATTCQSFLRRYFFICDIFTCYAVWKYNDQEFPSGSRFIPSSDFGKVTLDIRDTMAADSGVISCTVVNARGQTAVTTGTLKVASKGTGVLSATQLPAGQQGLENLQKFEASMNLMPCKSRKYALTRKYAI